MIHSRLERSLASAHRGPFLSPDGDGGGAGGGDGGTAAAGGTGAAGNNDANSSGNGGTGAAGGNDGKNVEAVTFVHEGKTYVLQDHANKLIGDARKDGKRTAEAEATRLANEAAAKASGDWQKLAEDRETQIELLQDQLAQRDREALRTKIAAKHKLPEALAIRLAGETEAELEADAKELSKHVKPPTAAETEAGVGNRTSNGGLSTKQKEDAAVDVSKLPAYSFMPARGVPIPQ